MPFPSSKILKGIFINTRTAFAYVSKLNMLNNGIKTSLSFIEEFEMDYDNKGNPKFDINLVLTTSKGLSQCCGIVPCYNLYEFFDHWAKAYGKLKDKNNEYS